LRALSLGSVAAMAMLAAPVERAAEAQPAASGRTGGEKPSSAGLAAEPEDGAPSAARTFDGTWTISHRSATCYFKNGTYTLVVAGGSVRGEKRSGRIEPSGTVKWKSSASTDAHPVLWTGTFRGNSGSGSYERRDGRCGGTFTAKRS
jgi:hypothetical protein